MADLSTTETIPLETGADGVLRNSKTRVTLDTIIAAFSEGATAEEIAQQYPSLPAGCPSSSPGLKQVGIAGWT
jgi:hypothetical protein